MGYFSQNNIRFQLKKYRKVISLDTEEWCEVSKKLTCSFYDMRNFVNFHQTTQKSQNLTLMVYFCPKYIWGLSRGVIFHDTEQWCKIWIKAGLVVSRMAWGIGWTFIRASKVWKIIYWWALFVQSSICFSKKIWNYISRHCRVMQNLKQSWFVAWKTT